MASTAPGRGYPRPPESCRPHQVGVASFAAMLECLRIMDDIDQPENQECRFSRHVPKAEPTDLSVQIIVATGMGLAYHLLYDSDYKDHRDHTG